MTTTSAREHPPPPPRPPTTRARRGRPQLEAGTANGTPPSPRPLVPRARAAAVVRVRPRRAPDFSGNPAPAVVRARISRRARAASRGVAANDRRSVESSFELGRSTAAARLLLSPSSVHRLRRLPAKRRDGVHRAPEALHARSPDEQAPRGRGQRGRGVLGPRRVRGGVRRRGILERVRGSGRVRQGLRRRRELVGLGGSRRRERATEARAEGAGEEGAAGAESGGDRDEGEGEEAAARPRRDVRCVLYTVPHTTALAW